MRPKMTKIPSIRLKKRNGGYFCYFGLQKGDIAKMREVGGGKCCILWLIYRNQPILFSWQYDEGLLL